MADNLDVTAGAGKTIAADEIGAVLFQRVKLIHGADGVNDGDVSTANPLPVIANAGSGTMAVYFDQSEPTVKVKNESTISVSLDPGHEIGSIKQINSSVAVYFEGSEPTVKAKYGSGTFAVSLDPGYELGSIKQINSSVGVYVDSIRQTIGVRVGQIDGTVAVYFDKSNPKVNLGVDIVNCAHTASVASAGGSVSSSTSGVSVSGVQIVAPEANRVIKVYAFSITTTAQTQIVPKFTNGSGGSPVELWRVALQAPTQGISGANLAVTPPGYLFATPSGATLCIVNDSASLIHYSIAYFKESA